MAQWPIENMLSEFKLSILRFQPGLETDFWNLHSPDHGCGWCFCSAWWVPEWDEWGVRSAEQNRAVREELLTRGEYDGYLLYRGERPIGWSQVGLRDRLLKLREQFGLEPDHDTWVITCFMIHPDFRRRGFARSLLSAILADLPDRGARRVEAFPRRGHDLDSQDLWNGPEALYLEAGFEVIRDDPIRPILELKLRN